MRQLLQNATFAARQFRKSPGFALTSILTIAIGIGATTAIFSLVNTVLRSLCRSQNPIVLCRSVYATTGLRRER